ncbi:MAG TPA: Nif3-like dinuclear metal center hexameric protein [Rikenellaceae bacterium]|nr:Nif3-like dinuclear metal center hexameric protein [Rikenellaceae bacterium]
MKVKDIVSVIEDFAPLSIQESWDNSGLIIGSPEWEVHGVLLGFDCTADLVDEAVKCGADMIVTHHPLIFGGIKKISPEDPVGLAILKAAAAGISVYAAHTTADKVLAGVSGAMARRLGLKDIQILDEEPGGYGLGAVGNLPEPMGGVEFIEYVKSKFGLKVARCSHIPEVPVERVAMCGGAGGSLIENALRAGAQAYLCGDISYHHFFTTKNFMVIDIGHFEGEVEIVEILFSLLKKKFPNFAIYTSARLEKSNPVYYY